MDVVKISTANSELLDELSKALVADFEICSATSLPTDDDKFFINIIDKDLLLKSNFSSISDLGLDAYPTFLTWWDVDKDYRPYAFDHGFNDFLLRPFYANVLRSKLKIHQNLATIEIAKKQVLIGSDDKTPKTYQCVHEHEMQVVQDAAILSLATIARIRDHSTGNHILRTQHYVKALAEFLKDRDSFKDELDPVSIELFYKTAALHDIGKVGIPDHILQKPGKLDAEEYELMKQHTVLGYQAIHSAELLIEQEIGGKAARFLTIAKQVTLSHHERWDGTGYPQGLKGNGIPVVARLMAVADVYDAMISRRPYKGEMDHQLAQGMIVEGSGTHFDPEVVEAFVALQETFERISVHLEDYFPSEADLTLHSMADLINNPE